MVYGNFERHELPDGSVVFYRDSDHSYWTEIHLKGGEWQGIASSRISSPSTISKFVDRNPDGLLDWAARLGPNWREKRNQAGDEGTAAHTVFENAMRGETTPLTGLSEKAQGYVIAIYKFISDHPDIETAQQEQVVYSKTHGYAGRFDWRGQVDRGKLDLLDLKTSKFVALGYFYQLALYELAARECGVGFTDRQRILQIKDDGTYKLIDSMVAQADALDCLRMFHSSRRVQKAMKEAA